MPQTFSPESPRAPLAGEISWNSLPINQLPIQIATSMARETGFVWLDSAMPGPGSTSILTARPRAILQGHIDHDWSQVETALALGTGTPGGFFGWVGFDGRFTLGVYDAALSYDHDSGMWSGMGDTDVLLAASASSPAASHANDWELLDFTPLVPKAAYTHAVSRAQEYIAAGDIYQVNLSHPWQAPWPEGTDFWPLYLRLREVSPAPHAACIHLAGTTVLSASPELFLKLDGRTITTRPIKGTRPRFPDDPIRDAASARELPLCEKERAELLMITDLERNDLGKVCEFGSVQTPDLWRVESFPQVYHLVSTVTGMLKPGISHAAAFRSCFPGGSISGAPKKRALEIIAELEKYPRGLYTGAMGYFGFDGSSQWNIAIRTAVQKDGGISFHTGSGIVADSVPEREWEETLHKASGILSAWS